MTAGQGTLAGADMAGVMREPRIRHRSVRAATLMIQTQRVGAGEVHGDAAVDEERQRTAQAGHDEPIFARRIEAGEVGFIHLLVRGRAVSPARGQARTSACPDKPVAPVTASTSLKPDEAGMLISPRLPR